MSFSHSQDLFSVADYDDISERFLSDTETIMPQFSISPPRVPPSLEADATIDPAVLLIQQKDSETCQNAAPIQHF